MTSSKRQIQIQQNGVIDLDVQKMIGLLDVASCIHTMTRILKRLEHDGLQNLVILD
jgi:hypothetical protein